MRIATFGSHSALQILKGAKDEGFETICLCLKGKDKPYRSFPVADDIIMLESFNDYFRFEEELKKKEGIIIPHASMIAYLGNENIRKITAKYFGDKEILDIESDREGQRRWLMDAGLDTPKAFKDASEIDRPCIVKFDGAAGGRGYFIAKSGEDVKKRVQGRTDFMIQEYVIGVPVYIHYFHSPITGETELLGFDRRYESNVDGIGRIPAADQMSMGFEPSYVVAGNTPLVLRESLLPDVLEMGEKVVAQASKLTKKGMIGPFCLETVLTPELRFVCFEISARIVAGTNMFPEGSPYTCYKYDIPMSTGRRIAREIRNAIDQAKLDMVLG